MMDKIKIWFTSRNTLKNFAGLLLGALAGYLYYINIGCTSGTCAITSNPYMSVLWGAAIGYLVFDLFKLKDKKTASES